MTNLQKLGAPRRRALPLLVAAAFTAITLVGCSTPAPAPEPEETTGGVVEDIRALLPEAIQESNVIRIGITVDDPPFMSKDGDTPVGIIPDLAAAISEVLGVEIEYQEMPFPGLIPAAQADKIDLVWSSMFATFERQKVLDFVPFVHASYGMVVQKGNPLGIESLDDLCGTVSSTTRATVMATALEEQQAKCIEEGEEPLVVNLYDSQSAGQLQLQAGVVSSFVGTALPLRYLAANAGGGDVFEAVDATYPLGLLALGALNSNPDLAIAFKAALEHIIETGQYQEILDAHEAGSEALELDEVKINPATF